MKEVLKFLKNITPRAYQEEIFSVCKDKNCLVILPTGMGKTLIALMLTIERMLKFPDHKVLILAPTRPLAEQHFEYFKKNLPELFATIELFTGKTEAPKRKELWQSADIVFSTPQCIGNDIKNNLYDLKDVSLLVEDECHRCIKNYSYTYVAEKYRAQAKNPRILGLTASPGSEKEKIEKICKNLEIEAVEIRTRESDDVKEYLQELKFEVIKLDFPKEFEEIRVLLKKIFDKKVEELRNRKLLFMPPTKTFILDLQRKIMASIARGNKNFNLLLGASACSQAIKLQHALELLETQTLSSFLSYLQNLFDQAARKESKGVQNLVKLPEFNQAYIKTQELEAKKIEHPKLAKLKELVSEDFKNNMKTKIIVFAQFRDTVSKIAKTLNEIKGVNARVFVGQAKKSSKGKEDTGLSQKEQQEIIHEFSLGSINVLVATSIGEEGLDIPEVNAVIFYEPVPSEIRKIQRAGRTARLMEGKLIILMTQKTRDESYYWAAFNKEKKMKKAVESIKQDFKDQDNLQSKGENQEKLF
jgi:ERCC4-related helicase